MKVTVIGAGASGMMAAITAARAGAFVTVLEHKDRVGKKILSTGNGRCNMTNLKIDETCYYCGCDGFAMNIIKSFDSDRTLEFFKGLGLEFKNRDGYIYPNSDQASSVLDVLRLELSHLNIRVYTDTDIVSVKKYNNEFEIITEKEKYTCDRLILATGSMAAPVTGSDGSGYTILKGLGHNIIKPLPALVSLYCKENIYKQMTGVRCNAGIELYVDGIKQAEDAGELQITDYGISGIPVFQVSRFASKGLYEKKNVYAVIDFLPIYTKKELAENIYYRKKKFADRNACDMFLGVLNKKLYTALLKLAGIDAMDIVSNIEDKKLDILINNIKEFRANIVKTNSYGHAQVCCGGVDTAQLDFTTLESKLVPGLFMAGEVIDVDGICGGYNLQWAWASGYTAGRYAAGECRQ